MMIINVVLLPLRLCLHSSIWTWASRSPPCRFRPISHLTWLTQTGTKVRITDDIFGVLRDKTNKGAFLRYSFRLWLRDLNVPDPGGPSISGPIWSLKCTVVFKYAMWKESVWCRNMWPKWILTLPLPKCQRRPRPLPVPSCPGDLSLPL